MDPSLTDANCYGDICPINICPGNICPYQEYILPAQFDQTLMVGSKQNFDLKRQAKVETIIPNPIAF